MEGFAARSRRALHGIDDTRADRYRRDTPVRRARCARRDAGGGSARRLDRADQPPRRGRAGSRRAGQRQRRAACGQRRRPIRGVLLFGGRLCPRRGPACHERVPSRHHDGRHDACQSFGRGQRRGHQLLGCVRQRGHDRDRDRARRAGAGRSPRSAARARRVRHRRHEPRRPPIGIDSGDRRRAADLVARRDGCNDVSGQPSGRRGRRRRRQGIPRTVDHRERPRAADRVRHARPEPRCDRHRERVHARSQRIPDPARVVSQPRLRCVEPAVDGRLAAPVDPVRQGPAGDAVPQRGSSAHSWRSRSDDESITGETGAAHGQIVLATALESATASNAFSKWATVTTAAANTGPARFGNGESRLPMLGPDGETVVYISGATNLVFPVVTQAGQQAYATIITSGPTGVSSLISGTPERSAGSDVTYRSAAVQACCCASGSRRPPISSAARTRSACRARTRCCSTAPARHNCSIADRERVARRAMPTAPRRRSAPTARRPCSRAGPTTWGRAAAATSGACTRGGWPATSSSWYPGPTAPERSRVGSAKARSRDARSAPTVASWRLSHRATTSLPGRTASFRACSCATR